MPKTDVSKKKKERRAHNENRLHAHNEVHIHIGDKKKPKRRRRKAKGGHGGAVASTMHIPAPIYAQPSYAFPANRPQFFDPTTQADRERNQPMANMPAFGAHVPTGNGFNTQTPRVEVPHHAWHSVPTAEATPLSKRDEENEHYNQFRTPYNFSPLQHRYDESVSPSYSNIFPTKTAGLDDFEDINPMSHSSMSAFEDTNTASDWFGAKVREEERAQAVQASEQKRLEALDAKVKTAVARKKETDAALYQTKKALELKKIQEEAAAERAASPQMSDDVSAHTRSQTGAVSTRTRSKGNVKQTARGP